MDEQTQHTYRVSPVPEKERDRVAMEDIMHDDNNTRRWVIRGFQFNIIETKHWLPSGSISMFSCESLDGLVHDEVLELSLEAAMERIEDSLPEWIERTRASGRDVGEAEGGMEPIGEK